MGLNSFPSKNANFLFLRTSIVFSTSYSTEGFDSGLSMSVESKVHLARTWLRIFHDARFG